VNVAVQIAEQIADYLLTGAVTNALNMPSVSAEDAPKLAPYMNLATQMGSLEGQLTQSGIKAVSIEYEGHAAELNTKPITAAILQGLLSPMLEGVNMVSAPAIAKERDIDITEVRHDRPSEYQTLVTLKVTTEKHTRTVKGTLFAGKDARIVDINGIPMDAKLGKHMLFLTNEDKPGFIGGAGTVLGNAGINVATFNLGRSEEGGEALALIEVDQAVDDNVLDELRALPQVVRAQALAF
ncbi:MAG: ACT domain-containing protein, partial [Alphaproteobacteria bacterium]|nr:ACT domain-containing protein [Alphaproteobacteria bacterium]